MKTITTKRGIEIDLEIIERGNKSIEVLATCSENSKSFLLEFYVKFGEITEDNQLEFLDDADTTEIENWADETTIEFLSGQLNKWCVKNTETGVYYSVSICTFNTFTAIVSKRISNRFFMGYVSEETTLTGEEEIREFLYINR